MTIAEFEFIDVDEVTKAYKDPTSSINFQALRGIDLKIAKGTLTSIIGPSGAGKSTLLNIIGGMTKPSTGQIHIDGLPLAEMSNRELDYYRREVVGFVWQLPERNLLPHLSAQENLMFAMEVSGYPYEERKKRAYELLDSVGLATRMQHRLGQLSGGEAQRASLALALVNDPKILLSDEPTGELDSETTIEIIDYLKEINRERGVTMIIVTHDNRFERVTKQSYHILDGSIAGLRRSVNSTMAEDWAEAKREEISVVNQFGMVKIPPSLRQKYHIGNYVRFVERHDDLVIEAVEHQ